MKAKAKEISEEQAAGYFWKLFQMNAVPMICWKMDGQLTHVNDAFLKMIGYSRTDFEEGKINWRSLTPEGYEQLEERCIAQLRESPNGLSEPFEKEYVRKDGSRIKIRLYDAILDPADESGVGIILPISR